MLLSRIFCKKVSVGVISTEKKFVRSIYSKTPLARSFHGIFPLNFEHCSETKEDCNGESKIYQFPHSAYFLKFRICTLLGFKTLAYSGNADFVCK